MWGRRGGCGIWDIWMWGEEFSCGFRFENSILLLLDFFFLYIPFLYFPFPFTISSSAFYPSTIQPFIPPTLFLPLPSTVHIPTLSQFSFSLFSIIVLGLRYPPDSYLPTTNHQLSTTNYQLSTINYRKSPI